MQNNDIYRRAPNPNERLTNYRPEQPGFEFQRQDVSVAVMAATVAPIVIPFAAPPIGPTNVQEPLVEAKTKKPFTLGKAIVVFVAIVVVAVAGYLAYTFLITK